MSTNLTVNGQHAIRSIVLNGTTNTANATGLTNLGTISGGGGFTNAYVLSSPGVMPASFPYVITVTGTNFNLTSAQYVIYTTNNVTLTLPDATLNPGRTFHIKKLDGGSTLTVTNPTGTVDGYPTVEVITQYTAFELISNGIEWSIH